MTTSGYHDPIVQVWTQRSGAWEINYGLLPDGRWAVDFINRGTHPRAPYGQRTRHYHETLENAQAEAFAWVRS